MNNHVTDEERIIRIKRVLELISSGMSFRECANYLSKNEFQISHVTVRDYVNRAIELDFNLSEECVEVIKNNTPKTIEDSKVKQRAKLGFKLLKEGYTIEEVAKALKSTPMIVYRDFIRFQSLNDDILKEMGITREDIEKVKENMTKNSLDNLKNRKIS